MWNTESLSAWICRETFLMSLIWAASALDLLTHCIRDDERARHSFVFVRPILMTLNAIKSVLSALRSVLTRRERS